MENKKFIQIDLSKKSLNLPPVRNYGIDLLKIIAMINIINLHINQHSFLLNLNPLNPKYKQVYRLEAFSFWPVNAFGLISGIIGYKKYKFVNIIYIWFEYFFYSITTHFYSNFKYIKSPQIMLRSFFPLGMKRNWYVNAYFFMYLFLPFITTSIIRKYTFSNFYFFMVYLISSFITSEYLFLKWNIVFMKYYSPIIIIQALSLIFFFSVIKINHIFLIKVILFLNPLNFNVTLIHTLIINKYCDYIKTLSPNFLFFKLYGISILIYSISVSIDYFRFIFFKLLKIRHLCSLIEKYLLI
jgi:surface polysaccharide O-acyltransferase-like enzyme